MPEPSGDFPETLAGLGGYGARHLLADLLCGYNSPLSDDRVVEFEADVVREYIAEWLQRWPQVQEERSYVDWG